eukprot:309424-Pyramimonas_sp.AAC.1
MFTHPFSQRAATAPLDRYRNACPTLQFVGRATHEGGYTCHYLYLLLIIILITSSRDTFKRTQAQAKNTHTHRGPSMPLNRSEDLGPECMLEASGTHRMLKSQANLNDDVDDRDTGVLCAPLPLLAQEDP